MEKKRGIKVQCPFCKYSWKYKGEAEYYASCPKCRRNINRKKYNIGQNFK